MRIDKSKSVSDVTQGPAGVSTRRGAVESASAFGQVMKDESHADSHAVLAKLLQEITDQGEMIARRKDINDISRYRKLVSDFLDEAMRSSYRTDREGSFDARGRYKEYSVVKKVNEEVEKLTRDALSDQRDNLQILGQLGTIRGLLVDLMI